MATTALGPDPAQTVGELPAVGSHAPDASLASPELADFTLADLPGRRVVNIFPSVNTGVCAASVRKFNEVAAGLSDTTVVNVSMDLPFALAGFCAAEGIEDVRMGSAFRSDFGETWGARLVDTKFEGLLARAVVVLDADGTVLHSQVVPQIGQEPDYDAAIASLE